MDTTKPRTRSPFTARRVAGALTSAAAVAVLGVGALAPATAQAAGISGGIRIPAAVGSPLADPAAITTTSPGTTTVTYRWRGGQLERS